MSCPDPTLPSHEGKAEKLLATTEHFLDCASQQFACLHNVGAVLLACVSHFHTFIM